MRNEAWRKRGGFRRAGAAAAPLARAAGERRGFAERRLLTDWRAIVGADVADACLPLRITYRGGRGGQARDPGLAATLVVAARPGRAPEVQHMAPRIIERVNAAYGYNAVQALRVTQIARDVYDAQALAPGFAEDAAPALTGPPPAGGMDPPVSSAISALRDNDLRAALALLEANRRRAGLRKSGRPTP